MAVLQWLNLVFQKFLKDIWCVLCHSHMEKVVLVMSKTSMLHSGVIMNRNKVNKVSNEAEKGTLLTCYTVEAPKCIV